ncbi:DEAD/DEAH box helicase [Fibrella sp. HMF5335]|uniref:DEAD/DEAH box helicase n=2 Tax=Fibrella rubiginis TaxID=2817060 RepID=A0A939GD02_9BACT|nr:DEAD/DEAH box helicase [Fibrella rubiginis]
MNYKQATPIQEQAIPLIQEGKDLIACAQTGTGKTAAFLIPLLDKIAHAEHDHTSTLVLVPTRELAKQIDDQVEGFSYFVSATSIAIYGGGKGDDWDKQRKALETGADIIIATPGRLIAHMQMGYVNFDKLNYLVLDEADKMLDMGFSDDILKIVKTIPANRQTLLFSATMPAKIRSFAAQILNQPEEIRLSVSKPAAGIDQRIYLAKDHQKLPLLEHLMGQMEVESMVLFTSRKSEVNAIVRALAKRGYVAKGVSSDLEQEEREAVLREFKNKQLQIVVATDVLSRGIDVDNITHVVNYDVPRDAEDYVHRIGRTARANSTGIAITFVNEADMNKLGRIEKLIERKLERLSVTEELGFGPGPVAGEKDEPGPFSRGRDNGRNGRGGRDSRGGGRREGGRDGSRDRHAPRPAVAVANPAARAETAEVAALPDGETTVVTDGQPTEAGREGRRRNNRRRGRGPRPEGQLDKPTDANGVAQASADGEVQVLPTGQAPTEDAATKARRKKRRRNRGPRPAGVETATAGVPVDHSVEAPLPAVDLAPISTWREID